MRLATDSIRLVSGMAGLCPARSRVQTPPEAPNRLRVGRESPFFLIVGGVSTLRSPSVKRGLHIQVKDGNSTEIKRRPPYTMAMKMAKIGLSILLLTFSLSIAAVALVHAPPPVQPPVIGTPVINPTSPTSSDIVTVSVNVTSARSTIKNVTITYTTDNWKSTNTTIVATYNSTTTTATGRVPALAPNAHVEYYIVAFDIAGNSSLNNNNGSYFAYSVSTPTSLTSISTLTYILVAAGIAAAIAAVAFMILRAPQSKAKGNKSSSMQDQNWTRNSP